MTVPWLICFFAFIVAGRIFGQSPRSGREFRFSFALFTAIALLVVLRYPSAGLHLIWYLPSAILASNLIANRDLLTLKKRIDSIQFHDTDDLKRKVESEIERFNEELPEEKRIK